MSGHTKTIIRDLGAILQVPGAMALCSLPVCLVFAEHYAVWPLALTSAVSFGFGQTLLRMCRSAAPMRVSHAMVTAALAWVLVPLLGAVPIVLISARLPDAVTGAVLADGWNAVFESMSGFTSTGLTMVNSPSELPHSLQWWRSLSQWVGGIGIVVLTVSIFHPSEDTRRLYFAEVGQAGPPADISAVAREISWVYAVYTLLAIVALRVSGLSSWQAINYGMAGIATGGFGIDDTSMADFAIGSQLVMLVVVIAGAISFSVHRRLLASGAFAVLWKDSEVRALVALIGVGAGLLAAENRWSGSGSSGLDALFQWTSALTTSGFSTQAVQPWSASAKVLMCLAMTCGGAAGATTGGLRLRRVIGLVHAARVRVSGVAQHPWRLAGHKPIADAREVHHAARQVEASLTLLVLWVVAAACGTVLLLHAAGPGARLDDALFEASSALNNVGLTAGITSPELPDFGKLGLIILMYVGRLEIVPVLVLGAALLRTPGRRR